VATPATATAYPVISFTAVASPMIFTKLVYNPMHPGARNLDVQPW
jgi:hypothetical protein